jgi:uracil-DNA glycosylase
LLQLNSKRSGIIFLLWGAHAQKKEHFITQDKHHVLTAAHPSPMSVKGFYGCKHFSKTNALLEKEGQQPIDWNLSDWSP